MRIQKAFALVTLIVSSAQAQAQNVFNGTWRPDPEIYSATRKQDVFEVAGGYYECQTCTPPHRIKADGFDQPVAGSPYYDSLNVRIIDQQKIMKTAKKSGKTVAESEIVVSADGKTETERQTIYFLAPRPIELTTHSVRVLPGSSGAHSISGTWRATDAEVSNHVEDTIFKINGNTLEMSDRMGRSFSAKLDGTEAPYKGSEQFTSVTLKGIDDHTVEESDRREGKVVKISLWSVDRDGMTMHVRFDDTKGHVQEQTGHKVQ